MLKKNRKLITPCIPKLLQKNVYIFSLLCIRMSGKNINFENKKIKKSDFYENKRITKIDDIDVNKILVSKKESYGAKNSLKYFIGYNDNDVIRRLCVRLLQMTGYARTFDEFATMCFRVNNKQLLKNYNTICEKVGKLIKIDCESKPVYGDDEKNLKKN